jgi:hypothetical protein
MKKVPTAEDFLQDHHQISHFYDDKTNNMVCFSDDVQKAMIEFAKLHVEAALKEAIKNGEIVDISTYKDGGDSSYFGVDEQSILNSYPLENIK